MSVTEEYAQQLANQISDVEFIDLDTRPLLKSDIKNITNKQVISVRHNKGFDIQIRRQYIIERVCNIPTLMYSTDMFIVADDLMGKHPVEFNVDDMIVYVNGLLGY